MNLMIILYMVMMLISLSIRWNEVAHSYCCDLALLRVTFRRIHHFEARLQADWPETRH